MLLSRNWVVLALASSVEAYASPVLMKEVVEAINKNKYFLRIIINLFYCFLLTEALLLI